MQRPFRTALSLTVICGLLIFGAVPAAYAVPMLSLQSGSQTVTITDDGSGDPFTNANCPFLTGCEGVVGFAGSVGNFTLNVTTGFTKPAVGSANEPVLDILSFNATSLGGGGILIIKFSETGFTGSVPGLTGSIGGTTTGTGVTYSAYLSNTNTPFSGSLIGTTGVLTPTLGTSFNGVFSGAFISPVSPYALTQEIVIEHSGSSQLTSIDAHLHAPEPASLVLLGSGLVTLSLLGWRKKFPGSKLSNS
jgi:hypothetical protein